MRWIRKAWPAWLVVSATVVLADGTAAQSIGNVDTSGEWFGFAVAAESLPGARSGKVLGASLVLPLGDALGLEGRVTQHWLPRPVYSIGAPVLSGSATTVETSESDFGGGNFASLDARLRIVVAHGLVTTMGTGWAAARKDMPYVVGSVGIRRGARARAAVDLEFTSYRVRWTNVVAEYQDDVLVREISSRQYSTWETGFAIRFGIELPVTYQRPD